MEYGQNSFHGIKINSTPKKEEKKDVLKIKSVLKKKAPEMEVANLCYRCENRALYLESKKTHQPRIQCGFVTSSVISCPLYKPSRPVVVQSENNDPNFYGCRIASNEIELKKESIDKKSSLSIWVRAPKKRGRRKKNG